MGPETKTALIAASSPLVFLCAHGVCARLIKRTNPLSVAVIAVFGSFPFLFVILFAAVLGSPGRVPGGPFGVLAYFGTVILSFGFIYLNFFNMGETARRIRILHEVYEGKGGAPEAIKGRYSAQEVIKRRLERLIELGELRRDGKVYHLRGRRLFRVAVLVSVWSRFLGLQRVPRA